MQFDPQMNRTTVLLVLRKYHDKYPYYGSTTTDMEARCVPLTMVQ
jgi:hypothetical protein